MNKVIEIKLNKRLVINILLAVAVLALLLETVELGFVAYALKSGALCK